MKMHILPGQRGVSPSGILFGRPFILMPLRAFIKNNEESEVTLADYMSKMLQREEITSTAPPPSQSPSEQSVKVKPGDRVFIKVIKERTGMLPDGRDRIKSSYLLQQQ